MEPPAVTQKTADADERNWRFVEDSSLSKMRYADRMRTVDGWRRGGRQADE